LGLTENNLDVGFDSISYTSDNSFEERLLDLRRETGRLYLDIDHRIGDVNGQEM
jgi:hypothetical protein